MLRRAPRGTLVYFGLSARQTVIYSLSFSGIRKMTTNGQKAMDTIAKVTSLIALFIPSHLNTCLIRVLNSPSKALLAPSKLL